MPGLPGGRWTTFAGITGTQLTGMVTHGRWPRRREWVSAAERIVVPGHAAGSDSLRHAPRHPRILGATAAATNSTCITRDTALSVFSKATIQNVCGTNREGPGYEIQIRYAPTATAPAAKAHKLLFCEPRVAPDAGFPEAAEVDWAEPVAVPVPAAPPADPHVVVAVTCSALAGSVGTGNSVYTVGVVNAPPLALHTCTASLRMPTISALLSFLSPLLAEMKRHCAHSPSLSIVACFPSA